MTDVAGAAEPRMQALTVELLCSRPPRVDPERLLADLRVDHPASVLQSSGAGQLMVDHREPVRLRFGAPMSLLSSVGPFTDRPPDRARYDLTHTRRLEDVIGQARKAVASLTVSQVMGEPHTPPDRLAAFRSTVLAVCGQVTAVAAWWPTAQHLTAAPDPGDDRLMGLLNVRGFQAEGTEEGIVMDTLGLHAFGLPDVQCRFQDLPPTRVATYLYDTGYFVFERGDVLKDGYTLEGLVKGQRWRCRHVASARPPRRRVIELDPGPDYVAGRRRRR